MKLIYRASEDGWTCGHFWTKAENIGNTFIFIKTTNNRKFGGYRKVTFIKGSGNKADAKAFLFKLEAGEYLKIN